MDVFIYAEYTEITSIIAENFALFCDFSFVFVNKISRSTLILFSLPYAHVDTQVRPTFALGKFIAACVGLEPRLVRSGNTVAADVFVSL